MTLQLTFLTTFLLQYPTSSAGMFKEIRGQVLPFTFLSFTPYLNNVLRFQLNAISTVWFPDFIISCLSVVQYTFVGDRMLKSWIRESNISLTILAYAASRVKSMTSLPIQTSPGLSKIAQFRRRMVPATGSQLIDDVRRAPDNVLSMMKPLNEVCFK